MEEWIKKLPKAPKPPRTEFTPEEKELLKKVQKPFLGENFGRFQKDWQEVKRRQKK